MCGIVGLVSSQRIRDQHVATVSGMLKHIVHRGPDGEGLAQGPHFCFGHRRLAIIDIEGGRQPMQTRDGRFTITFNGEIYNYLELRQELIRSGESFTTFSDTEVLLTLFAREGLAALQKLNGMFAFAVFDHAENELTLVRDPFGIKPLYYFVGPNGDVHFGSEIKTFLAVPEFRCRVDYESLEEYLTFQFCLGQNSMFKDVKKIEAGHVLKWSKHSPQPKIIKYWDLDFDVDFSHSESWHSERILAAIEHSVQIQLRSDVPVGAHLSGGLDSSVIATVAARNLMSPLTVFTGRFAEGPAYDESSYARIVSDQIKATYVDVVPTQDDFVSGLSKLIYMMDEPLAGPGLFPQYIVSREAAKQVKVILGGQGADEIFGGYARYVVGYLEQALKGAIHGTHEEGRHLISLESMIPNLGILKGYQPMLQSFWQEGLFAPMDERYFRLVDRSHDSSDYISKDVLKTFNKQAIFEKFKTIFNSPETSSYFNKMTCFDLKTLLPALLHVEDRVSMSVSLESRVPFLDTHLVNLVTRIPPGLKFKGGQTKHMLKQAVQNVVPQQILSRKDKMGFPVPLKEWSKKGPVLEFISDTLLSKKCRERGFFQNDRLTELVDNEKQFGRQVWGALCLELWHQNFIDGHASN